VFVDSSCPRSWNGSQISQVGGRRRPVRLDENHSSAAWRSERPHRGPPGSMALRPRLTAGLPIRGSNAPGLSWRAHTGDRARFDNLARASHRPCNSHSPRPAWRQNMLNRRNVPVVSRLMVPLPAGSPMGRLKGSVTTNKRGLRCRTARTLHPHRNAAWALLARSIRGVVRLSNGRC
jgi:hypothetical protein